jgi:hypothetical protein
MIVRVSGWSSLSFILRVCSETTKKSLICLFGIYGIRYRFGDETFSSTLQGFEVFGYLEQILEGHNYFHASISHAERVLGTPHFTLN